MRTTALTALWVAEIEVNSVFPGTEIDEQGVWDLKSFLPHDKDLSAP
jgi:hypothetical protein